MKIIISLTVLSLIGILWCLFRRRDHVQISVIPSERDLRQADLERAKNLGKVIRGYPIKPEKLPKGESK